jgi:hypothetical protein
MGPFLSYHKALARGQDDGESWMAALDLMSKISTVHGNRMLQALRAADLIIYKGNDSTYLELRGRSRPVLKRRPTRGITG